MTMKHREYISWTLDYFISKYCLLITLFADQYSLFLMINYDKFNYCLQ